MENVLIEWATQTGPQAAAFGLSLLVIGLFNGLPTLSLLSRSK